MIGQPRQTHAKRVLLECYRRAGCQHAGRFYFRVQSPDRKDHAGLIERKPFLRGCRARPPVNMHVECIAAPGVTGVVTPTKTPAICAEDCTAVGVEPPTHFTEYPGRCFRHSAIRLRSDVEQIVASLFGAVDQICQHRSWRFPTVVRGRISPTVVESHAGLPGAVRLRRFDFLLGGGEIPLESVAIVDDDVRLQLEDHAVNAFRFPLIRGERQADVVPKNVDLAVVGEQLADETVGVVDEPAPRFRNGVGPTGVTGGAVFKYDTRGGGWTDITPGLSGSMVVGGGETLVGANGQSPGVSASGTNRVSAVQALDVGADRQDGPTELRAGGDIAISAPAAPIGGYMALSLDRQRPGTLVVASMNRGSPGDTIWRSTDGGAHWRSLREVSARDVSATPFLRWGRPQADFGWWIAGVAVDPFDSNFVAYTTGATVYATHDVGSKAVAWAPWVEGVEQTAILTLTSPPKGPSLLSGFGDISGFAHEDLNVSPSTLFTNPVFANTNTIDYAGMAPQVVVRSGTPEHRTSLTEATLSFSTDYGRSWSELRLPSTQGAAGRPGGAAVCGVGSRFGIHRNDADTIHYARPGQDVDVRPRVGAWCSGDCGSRGSQSFLCCGLRASHAVREYGWRHDVRLCRHHRSPRGHF